MAQQELQDFQNKKPVKFKPSWICYNDTTESKGSPNSQLSLSYVDKRITKITSQLNLLSVDNINLKNYQNKKASKIWSMLTYKSKELSKHRQLNSIYVDIKI